MATITLSDGSPQALPPPDAIAQGNTGTPGVWRFASTAPGPRVAITALIHGNEVCGAHAAWQLVQSAPRPARGSLTVVFCNLEAYARLAHEHEYDHEEPRPDEPEQHESGESGELG